MGAASTTTVSVLAYRLYRMARKATRWAVARVQGIAADIGVRSRVSCNIGVQRQEIRDCLCQHRSMYSALCLASYTACIGTRLTITAFSKDHFLNIPLYFLVEWIVL